MSLVYRQTVTIMHLWQIIEGTISQGHLFLTGFASASRSTTSKRVTAGSSVFRNGLPWPKRICTITRRCLPVKMAGHPESISTTTWDSTPVLGIAGYFGKGRMEFNLKITENISSFFVCFRRDDEVFSFIERTTLLFCEILCSLALSLGLIALPSCRLKDGLGINGFDSFLYVTGYTTLIACVVFAMFAPISILFRWGFGISWIWRLWCYFYFLVYRHASKKYYHKDPFLEEKAFVSRRVNKCCWYDSIPFYSF